MGAEDAGARGSRAGAQKPRVNARKRTRRSRVIESDDDEDDDVPMTSTAEAPASPAGSPPPAPAPAPAPCSPAPELSAAAFELDMEADISQLEPVTFTTIRRGPPEPMLRLSWHHKVNLMGEKVLNPLIYVCEKCDCPVLSYGRMIPCKHVLCFDCAQPLKQCWRCGERAVRVERAGLGKLFMCLHDGKRYDNNGCRRTYLSQRDLQAHINHRHLRPPASAAAPAPAAQPPPPPPALPTPSAEEPRREPRTLQRELSMQRSAADPRSASHRTPPAAAAPLPAHKQASPPGYCGASPLKQQQIPVISSQRTGNLITIAIQGQEPAPSPVSLEPPSPVPPPVPTLQYAGYSQQYSYPGQPEPPPAAAAASYYQSTPPPVPAPPGYGRPFSAPAGVPPRPQPYPTAVPPPQQTWPVSTPPPTLSRPPPDRRFYR